MPLSQDVDIECLARENDEYRELTEKHRFCEKKLDKLNDRHFLNESERVEAVRLKKQKLALKDRMAEIARSFVERSGSRPGN